MDNKLLRLKLKQRLNKLASNDFTNLECWQEAELINKAQLQIVRRNLHGNNIYQEGDEQSTTRVDDFQKLLLQKELRGTNNLLFFETVPLPSNYLKFKRVTVWATTKECKTERRMTVSLVEEANIDELLADNLLRPSFKWAETFCTLIGDKVRIYTGGDFSVQECRLTYYRMPRPVIFEGCRDVNDNAGTDQELEFKDDVIEMILDEAVAIAAADMNDYNNYSRTKENVENGN